MRDVVMRIMRRIRFVNGAHSRGLLLRIPALQRTVLWLGNTERGIAPSGSRSPAPRKERGRLVV